MNRDYSDVMFISIIAVAVAILTLDSVFDLGILPDPLGDFKPYVETSEVVRFKDVRPLFENRCLSCHSAAHWNWTNYETAYKKRNQIRNRVWITRNMPFGQSMPEEERRKIKDWVDGGAKE